MKTALLTAALLAAALGVARAADPIALDQLSHIHGIAVDPAGGGRLYLATHHGLFLAAPDGTATPVSRIKDDFMGFSPHPDEPDTFYASGHPAGGGNLGFIVSTDRGQTWAQRAPGVKGPVDFHAMTVSRADPRVIYGTHGGLQVSRDGGHTWAMVGPLPDRVIDLAAPADSPDHLYAATEQGLLESLDGGKTWRPAHLFRAPTSVVETGPGGEVYAYMLGVGLMKRQEGDWTRLADLGEGFLLHLAVAPDDPRRLYGVTRQGQLLESRDGGASWQPYGGP